MEPEQRVLIEKNNVALHVENGCVCHPIRVGCCERVKDEFEARTVEMIDAMDASSFGWHVEPPCVVDPAAAARVVKGASVRFIGDDLWRDMVKAAGGSNR